ncbi:unnamed protein product [Mesocestoides corti]|uniref:Transient receptor ion channel domain-containing protein n=1 Tax=Mesocestoides corti TaxID=53468 RepID=A0A158QSU4_MESCO|nr:unnamed protein product [Mesocestoides corti]
MANANSGGVPSSSPNSDENIFISGVGSAGVLMLPPERKMSKSSHLRSSPSSTVAFSSKLSCDNHNRRHLTDTISSKRSSKTSLQPKDLPHLLVGTDQKMLPLPPVRANSADWFSRSFDRSASSAVVNENVAASPTPSTPTYRRGHVSPNVVRNYNQSHPLSRIFLDAVERGDKSTVARCLKCANPVNVNCTNMLGRTAIQIAVDNENFEIVELLLKEPNIRIGDALLYAVQEGVYRIVEMLIDHHSITKEMLGTSWSKRISLSEESPDFSADISPIILASICNQFEILQLLLSRGAHIERPHRSNCNCNNCAAMYKEDSLKYSLWRINTYRALASPAWISLTSPDPVLAAFKLSWELSNLASRENEFKEVFIQLSDQCKKYACDLLDQCRSTEEVLAVLSRTSDDQSDERSKEYDESTNQKGRTALCRTTTVTQKYKRRWYRPSPQADNSFELEDLEDCDGLTRLEHHKRLESQYTIMEDLASLTNHQEQGYHIGEKGQSERMNEKMKNKEYMESDMDEVSDEEQYDESGEDCFDESESEDVPAQLRLDRLKLAIKYDQKRFVAHPHCQHILTTLWYDQLPGWRKRHPILKLLLCFGFVLALPFLAIIYLFYPRGSVARVLRSPLIKFVNHSASIAIFLILLLIASTDGESVKSLEVRQLTRGPDPNLIELLIAWWVFGFVWSEMKQIWEEGFKAYVRQWWNWLDFIMLTLFLTTVGLRVVGLILRKTGRYGFDPTSREHWPSNDPTLLSEAFFAIAHIFSFARIIFLFQALFWHLFGVTQINQYRIQTKDAEGNLIDLKSAQVTMTVGEILLMIYHAMAIIVLVNMLIAMMSNSFQTIQAITRILVRRYIHVSKKTMRQGVVNEDDLLEIKQDISSLRLVRRIPASSGSPTTQSTSELQGLKNEIITEVKGELHSFAKQLMQFMNQCHVSGPPSEHTSDGESFLAHRGAATGATVFTTPLSRGTEIDRERIGGVSMTCSPASGLSLAAPRHPNSRA